MLLTSRFFSLPALGKVRLVRDVQPLTLSDASLLQPDTLKPVMGALSATNDVRFVYPVTVIEEFSPVSEMSKVCNLVLVVGRISEVSEEQPFALKLVKAEHPDKFKDGPMPVLAQLKVFNVLTVAGMVSEVSEGFSLISSVAIFVHDERSKLVTCEFVALRVVSVVAEPEGIVTSASCVLLMSNVANLMLLWLKVSEVNSLFFDKSKITDLAVPELMVRDLSFVKYSIPLKFMLRPELPLGALVVLEVP